MAHQELILQTLATPFTNRQAFLWRYASFGLACLVCLVLYEVNIHNQQNCIQTHTFFSHRTYIFSLGTTHEPWIVTIEPRSTTQKPLWKLDEAIRRLVRPTIKSKIVFTHTLTYASCQMTNAHATSKGYKGYDPDSIPPSSMPMLPSRRPSASASASCETSSQLAERFVRLAPNHAGQAPRLRWLASPRPCLHNPNFQNPNPRFSLPLFLLFNCFWLSKFIRSKLFDSCLTRCNFLLF